MAEGLVQLPAYEFVMIAEHRTEYAIRKRGATTAEDVREARRFGESMPTYSGHQTRVTELAVRLVPLEHATPLTTYDEIQAAMLAQQPITCRTSYTAAANGTRVVLEYPAKIVNVQHDRPNWQIDTGPILVPDFEATSTLFVGRLELAYILFNSWNRAEVLERRPTPVTSAGDRGPQTSHYSAVHSLAVRNELLRRGAEVPAPKGRSDHGSTGSVGAARSESLARDGGDAGAGGARLSGRRAVRRHAALASSAESRRPAHRQAGGAGAGPGSRQVAQEVQRGPDAGRAGQGREASAGGAAFPEEPMVVKPVHSIGKYGGTWRRGFTGRPTARTATGSWSTDKILFWDYTGTKIMPCVARDWRLSDDGKVCTIFLRKGMKWSDGHPFTADDFVFWYEDVYLNKDLQPTPHPDFMVNGKPGRLSSATTTRWSSSSPSRTTSSWISWPEHRHGRRPGPRAVSGRTMGALHAGPLPEAVPPEAHREDEADGRPRRRASTDG